MWHAPPIDKARGTDTAFPATNDDGQRYVR
jgi:hypothetical protein